MAITTVAGAVAGMMQPVHFVKAASGTMVAGRPQSLFYLAGTPAAAAAPAPGIAGAALTTYAGQLYFTNPASGNTYLARIQGSALQQGTLLLCDRLWHNSGISVTTTTAQTINSAAWPARDVSASTNGDGVYIGMEVRTATGAGAATPSISYTNQAGTAGQTGTTNAIITYTASSTAGAFYPFSLAAGDTGVRSIQTITLSVSMTSGAIHLVAYRVLAKLEITTTNVPNAADALTVGFPRLYDNTVPFLLFIPQTTTSSTIAGHVIWTQG